MSTAGGGRSGRPAGKEGDFTIAPNPRRTYDIARAGQRFLMIKSGADGTAVPVSLIVVQHWIEELKCIVSTC